MQAPGDQDDEEGLALGVSLPAKSSVKPHFDLEQASESYQDQSPCPKEVWSDAPDACCLDKASRRRSSRRPSCIGLCEATAPKLRKNELAQEEEVPELAHVSMKPEHKAGFGMNQKGLIEPEASQTHRTQRGLYSSLKPQAARGGRHQLGEGLSEVGEQTLRVRSLKGWRSCKIVLRWEARACNPVTLSLLNPKP